MIPLADHLGLTGLLVAGGALGVWILSKFHRPLSTREGARSIGRVLTWFSVLLTISGWTPFPRLSRRAAAADERRMIVGVMIGVAVAAVAVRTGARLEQVRSEEGAGTPASVMATRATFLFLLLTLVAGVALRGETQVPILGLLCGVWIPSLVLWRRNPRAGPMGPANSTAWRATFFGLAVTALASISIAAFQEHAGAGPMSRGLWAGVGGSSALLASTAWLATRLTPGQAIAVTGTLCGVAGALLLGL